MVENGAHKENVQKNENCAERNTNMAAVLGFTFELVMTNLKFRFSMFR